MEEIVGVLRGDFMKTVTKDVTCFLMSMKKSMYVGEFILNSNISIYSYGNPSEIAFVSI